MPKTFVMLSPSFRRVFSLKSHLEAHANWKRIINSLQIFVYTDNELASPEEIHEAKEIKAK